MKRKEEVLVVGAGPVGLATTVMLQDLGVDVRVIDEQWRSTARSYALALHPGTLDILSEIGVVDELLRIGKKLVSVELYAGHERVGEVSYSDLPGNHPFLLVVPQSELEGELTRRVRERGAPVQWNHRLAWLHRDEARPVAEIERLEKESSGYGVAHTEWVVDDVRELSAEFIIGADGHRSVVRRELEIPFEAIAEAQVYAVFEFAAEYEKDSSVHVVFGERGTSVLWPLGGGRFRFSFPLPPLTMVPRREKSRLFVHVGDASFPMVGAEQLEGYIRRDAPWFQVNPTEIAWAVAVRFESRLAREFGRDRVWLAGDAAHLAGPIGVHSMNRGIAEGRVLSTAIHEVLRKAKPADAVQSAGSSCREPWVRLMSRTPKVADGAPEWVRGWAARVPGCIPASGAHLDALLSQLGIELAER